MINEIFPNESLGDVVSFLKDLKGLLPIITAKDRLNSGLYDLKSVIGIVYQMMYGDDVEQFMSVNMRLSQAEESLRKLATKVNEEVVVKLRDAKRDLKDEIDTLNKTKDDLEEEIDGLGSRQQQLGEELDSLTNQVNDLGSKKDKLASKLKNMEETGKQEVETVIGARRKELDKELEKHQQQVEKDKKAATASISTEIDLLEARKADLLKVIGELETSLANYDKRIDSLSREENEDIVRWEPLKKDDLIFSIKVKDFEEYYKSLIDRYCIVFECTPEKAKQEFLVNCPGILQLKKLYYDNRYGFENYTTRRIMNENWNLTSIVKGIIATMKMPVFEKTKGKMINSVVPVASTKTPENLQVLLRELELQKKLIQVSADARIYQAYATTLIQILASVTPKDMDLSNLLLNYGMSSDFINLISAPIDEDRGVAKK